jgi:hypothetical protein
MYFGEECRKNIEYRRQNTESPDAAREERGERSALGDEELKLKAARRVGRRVAFELLLMEQVPI